MALKRRTEAEKGVDDMIKEVVDKVESPLEELPPKEYDMTKVISTGSTGLDLSISGGRRYAGGIPGGVIMEISGPAGCGKTAILSEIGASAQIQGGEADFKDPEGRLDKEYSKIYGVSIDFGNYSRPKTVSQVFDSLKKWKPKNPNVINVSCTDSLAALSTDLELEKGDKMGQKRAKEFSEGFRTTAIMIADKNWIMANSNQQRDGDYGPTTPGGQAIKFYSSLRVRITTPKNIEKQISLEFLNKKKPETIEEKKQKEIDQKEKKSSRIFTKVIGIESSCSIIKSSVDDPHRKCKIFLLFNYGIDKTRENLQYLKDMTGNTVYECPDGKTYIAIDKAIIWTELNNLENQLEKNAIDIWHTIEEKFRITRSPKIRF